ncbi:TetR/AcrR family transcriptional regulator [Pseudomonas lopnurensis]|uniref:TetR/AcrR family transcriptional regulator n=1 Tax=Pseudomonas lopnurensis TaxID=1477517 RepID=UPI0028A70C44|nr:TetR/AcrR family transcriptional regulator [Pseudomonas lopnurensis]
MTTQLFDSAPTIPTNDNSDDRDTLPSQRVIDAALRCLDQLGLDKTTVDDIARESNISRATLYRRFGNKEAIFAAALQQQSRPFEGEVSAILTGPGNLAERIERLLVWAVIEVPENLILRRLLDQGQSPTSMQIFNSVFREKIRSLLQPVVCSAKINGELAPDLSEEMLVDWIIREMLMIKMAAPWKEADLRKHVHHFIKPVLGIRPLPEPTSQSDSVEQRLTRLEQRLVEMHQLLGQIRHELKGERG